MQLFGTVLSVRRNEEVTAVFHLLVDEQMTRAFQQMTGRSRPKTAGTRGL